MLRKFLGLSVKNRHVDSKGHSPTVLNSKLFFDPHKDPSTNFWHVDSITGHKEARKELERRDSNKDFPFFSLLLSNRISVAPICQFKIAHIR